MLSKLDLADFHFWRTRLQFSFIGLWKDVVSILFDNNIISSFQESENILSLKVLKCVYILWIVSKNSFDVLFGFTAESFFYFVHFMNACSLKPPPSMYWIKDKIGIYGRFLVNKTQLFNIPFQIIEALPFHKKLTDSGQNNIHCKNFLEVEFFSFETSSSFTFTI